MLLQEHRRNNQTPQAGVGLGFGLADQIKSSKLSLLLHLFGGFLASAAL
jgi:hypothetical protein